MWLSVLVAILAGYLLGNLNGAICVSMSMQDDVRSHGSGNAGLTNFIRNYGASPHTRAHAHIHTHAQTHTVLSFAWL